MTHVGSKSVNSCKVRLGNAKRKQYDVETGTVTAASPAGGIGKASPGKVTASPSGGIDKASPGKVKAGPKKATPSKEGKKKTPVKAKEPEQAEEEVQEDSSVVQDIKDEVKVEEWPKGRARYNSKEWLECYDCQDCEWRDPAEFAYM